MTKIFMDSPGNKMKNRDRSVSPMTTKKQSGPMLSGVKGKGSTVRNERLNRSAVR